MILSDGSSIHTKKWVNALVKRGIKIHLFSLKSFGEDEYPQNDFTYTVIDCQKRNSGWGGLGKISYLKALPELKKQISKFAPDIVHAHFASSYGLLGVLSGFHPLIVSVWGSDVFDFPNRSFIHKDLFKFILRKADSILSTSNIMAVETKKFTRKDVKTTPFGIDLDTFRKKEVSGIEGFLFLQDTDIVVGTIKLLEPKYGLEFLLKAFSLTVEKHPELPLKLIVAGDGSIRKDLYRLAENLNIINKTIFAGMIGHRSVPEYLNMFDVFCALSIEESFGVAVVEAQACGVPVVVSDAGGLPEVVEDGVTGFVVTKRDAVAAAEAIEKLIIDRKLRESMGREGRKRVERLYDWEQNVDKMTGIYHNIILENHGREK